MCWTSIKNNKFKEENVVIKLVVRFQFLLFVSVFLISAKCREYFVKEPGLSEIFFYLAHKIGVDNSSR